MPQPAIACPTCKTGEMTLRRLYRLNGSVVFFAHLAVVAAALGFFISLGFSLGIQFAPEKTVEFMAKNIELSKVWVMIARVGGILGEFDMANQIANRQFLWQGPVIYLGIGFLAELLVMKKSVLRCGHCSTTVAAS